MAMVFRSKALLCLRRLERSRYLDENLPTSLTWRVSRNLSKPACTWGCDHGHDSLGKGSAVVGENVRASLDTITNNAKGINAEPSCGQCLINDW